MGEFTDPSAVEARHPQAITAEPVSKEQLMSLFAVTREAGPGWTDGKGAFEQPTVNDHATFMNDLASEGVVLFAGPLGGSERDRIRVLLIAEAASETDVHRRLADDPWARTRRIVTTSVEPWLLVVGAEAVGSVPATG
jgi:uncharacterized protein YciI